MAAMTSAPPAGAAEMWDSRYGASPELAYGEKANDWLSTGSELAKFVPDGGKIVELASGEGRNVVWLASQGYDAHGVDISAKGVEKAIKFAESRGVGDKTTFTVGDATAHGLDDSYDAVVCVFAHMPPPLKVKLFENVMRILKPNGVLIGQWYTPTHVEKKDAGGWGTGGPPVKALCVSKAELNESVLGRNGAFLKLEEEEREVNEGSLHSGMAHVVNCVWIKPMVVEASTLP